ncbi:hypothetical protein SDC9_151617 [bioreactor metagenome]|uniref:Uncharacterized protein n=1 Tax=bioreactor metagenome TaxID=1076179 RepID=A0A645ESJ7_9ZZZZ
MPRDAALRNLGYASLPGELRTGQPYCAGPARRRCFSGGLPARGGAAGHHGADRGDGDGMSGMVRAGVPPGGIERRRRTGVRRDVSGDSSAVDSAPVAGARRQCVLSGTGGGAGGQLRLFFGFRGARRGAESAVGADLLYVDGGLEPDSVARPWRQRHRHGERARSRCGRAPGDHADGVSDRLSGGDAAMGRHAGPGVRSGLSGI